MFKLEILKLNWIKDDGTDDPNDLCAHGTVCVTIGDEQLDAKRLCVSAGAIFLLRSLTEDHTAEFSSPSSAEPIIPCCGNGIFADENDPAHTVIVTCPNGIDFTVIHNGDNVKLITESDKEIVVPLENYRREVYAFADEVEKFYAESAPKEIFATEADSQKGYEAMWREWIKLRYNK